MIPPAILRELLTNAASEPYGLCLKVQGSVRSIIQQLHTINAEIRADVMICTPSLEQHIFLTRRSVELYE